MLLVYFWDIVCANLPFLLLNVLKFKKKLCAQKLLSNFKTGHLYNIILSCKFLLENRGMFFFHDNNIFVF